MTSHAGDQKASIPQRLREEIFKYGIASGYLFVSFSVLLIYEVSVAGGGHEVLPFGIALVKALVLGKFLLIGDAMKVGSRYRKATVGLARQNSGSCGWGGVRRGVVGHVRCQPQLAA